MPQLWRSNSASGGGGVGGQKGRPTLVVPSPQNGGSPTWSSNSAASTPTLRCLSPFGGGAGSSSAASTPPMSPSAAHRHPPKYDQLVTELKRAQERRGRLLQSLAADDPSLGGAASHGAISKNATTAHPAPSSGGRAKQPANGHGGVPFQNADGCQSAKSNGKQTTQKRVRFLEDGTGNLHTSVFGGSAESVGSLLDAHQELSHSTVDDIDSLISSLISYSDAHDLRRASPPERVQQPRAAAAATNGASVDLRELRIPLSALTALNVHEPSTNGSDSTSDDGDDLMVVDQRQTVIHLEPDDPNSIDSGSVLSELDFEETSSTITDVDSTKTFSLSSPDYVADQRLDDWSQVSDLLEKSLQEIRQMEEDTNRSLPPPLPPPLANKDAAAAAKREPLYELIGWKRNEPPVQLDLKGSKPHPLPAIERTASPEPPPSPVLPPPALDPEPDIWVPRQDFVPPPQRHEQTNKEKVWTRRPTLLANANNSHASIASNGQHSGPARKINMFIEDNALYGRVWETGSNNNGSSRSSTSSNDVDDAKTCVDSDLSAIRSIARKARLEHWRLTGMPTSSDEQQVTATNECCTPNPANLSALPLFNHRTRNGIQLTWPPPPIPHSPSSSSANTTPVTPTLPPLPDANGHSPKCFGHQRTFQWPVPALKMPKSPPVQRKAVAAKETPPPPPEKTSWRPIKPANMEDAQNWYWTEEFPLAAGLEPGTGNMSAWFHGAISRSEAERRLAGQPTGAFLVRLTERLWGYAISVRTQSGNVSHFLVDAGERRGHKKYSLLGSNDPTHKTLRELIQYYGKNAMTPDRSEKLLFPCPQESAVHHRLKSP